MKHIIVLNLTSDKLDSSFSLVAEMTGATVTIGWINGAPPCVTNSTSSITTHKITIPVISDLLSEKLQGFSLEKIMSLEFVVVGGSEEIKRWIAYLCGRWNITCTFWFQKSPNIFSSETIRPGSNDPIMGILFI